MQQQQQHMQHNSMSMNHQQQQQQQQQVRKIIFPPSLTNHRIDLILIWILDAYDTTSRLAVACSSRRMYESLPCSIFFFFLFQWLTTLFFFFFFDLQSDVGWSIGRRQYERNAAAVEWVVNSIISIVIDLSRVGVGASSTSNPLVSHIF